MRKQNPSTRIPGLDLLRAAAILLVLVAHYPKTSTGLAARALNFGWIGVDLFFVLSGYLIGGQLLKPLLERGEAETASFYLRRFARTLPNYFVVLGAYVALIAASALPGPRISWHYAVFVQNFSDLVTFSPSWSLCVEEQFYLLLPVVSAILFRARSARLRLWIIPAFLLIEIVLRAAIWLAVRPDMLPEPEALAAYMRSIYNPTYSRLDGILLGVGIAALKYGQPKIWTWLLENHRLLSAVSLSCFIASVLIFWHRYSLPGASIGFTLLALCFASLTIVALSPFSILSRWRVPGAEWIALLSYSIYLTHSLALAAGESLFSRLHLPADSPVRIPLMGALLVLLASALYYGLERPVLTWRDRLLRNVRARTSAGASAPAPELIPVESSAVSL